LGFSITFRTMTYKDRTAEFFSIIDTVGSRRPTPPSLKSKKISQRSQFSALAGQIGRDIISTTEKLESLTQLARNKNLCEDRPQDVQELTSIVNQDIKNINHQISILQQLSRGWSGKQAEQHSDMILTSLKLQLKDTTKGFSEVLETRTENLKKQQELREKLTEHLRLHQGEKDLRYFINKKPKKEIIPMNLETLLFQFLKHLL